MLQLFQNLLEVKRFGTEEYEVRTEVLEITDPGGKQWWLWPAGIWGAFVLINFLKVFIFKGGAMKRFEDQLTQKELERMDREE